MMTIIYVCDICGAEMGEDAIKFYACQACAQKIKEISKED